MKATIFIITLLLCGISLGFAQMTAKEFEVKLSKLSHQMIKLNSINAAKHRLKIMELEEELYINRQDSTLTPDEERIIREKIAAEEDSLEIIANKRSILTQQSDSLTLAWVRSVLTQEEISDFVKRLLETDDNNRYKFWDKELKAINSRDSLTHIRFGSIL
jgi:hypothetical protein